jgi:transcription initiation factor TFIIIB Brf1 subunit/transcription initiation factor TFIIB
MQINPDWNYGYLRTQPSDYGVDPFTLAAIASVGLKVAGGLKSSSEAKKQAEIMSRQQRQADRAAREEAVVMQNLALVAQAKQEQEEASQKALTKNVLLGFAILGVLGAGIYVANKYYFSK